ncbi:MAG: hypothetical protein JOZ60_06105 [Verrucomicrobia bacterium]|nr:hypothetical protein [Verrucomicrobiota bacterium]
MDAPDAPDAGTAYRSVRILGQFDALAQPVILALNIETQWRTIDALDGRRFFISPVVLRGYGYGAFLAWLKLHLPLEKLKKESEL